MFGYGSDPMPADKLMKLFIIQSISAFLANDYENGIHYLREIKQTYAEQMSKLNPTLKQLAKEIIQSVDMFNPDGSGFMGGALNNNPQEPLSGTDDNQPQMPSFDIGGSEPTSADVNQTQQPTSVANELQDLLNRRRAKRRK